MDEETQKIIKDALRETYLKGFEDGYKQGEEDAKVALEKSIDALLKTIEG